MVINLDWSLDNRLCTVVLTINSIINLVPSTTHVTSFGSHLGKSVLKFEINVLNLKIYDV